MKTAPHIHLSDVQSVYSGAEGRLWQLLMGEQIHIGGLRSSMELAELAHLGEGQCGVDLCCALGAGMRFLLRFRQVAHMTGVDATPAMLELARRRAAEEGFSEQTTFIQAEVCATGLPGNSLDFVWGEDAWCYVEDKHSLIAEAVRVVKPGGLIAFTDWIEGTVPLTAEEAGRYLAFMKFPGVLSLEEYRLALKHHGCDIPMAKDTGRFAAYMPLYIEMIEKQLTFDALKIIGFDQDFAALLLGEMRFILALAQSGKIAQGLVIAQKRR